MNWQGKTVGYAITGSHCTFEEVMPVVSGLKMKVRMLCLLFQIRC